MDANPPEAQAAATPAAGTIKPSPDSASTIASAAQPIQQQRQQQGVVDSHPPSPPPPPPQQQNQQLSSASPTPAQLQQSASTHGTARAQPRPLVSGGLGSAPAATPDAIRVKHEDGAASSAPSPPSRMDTPERSTPLQHPSRLPGSPSVTRNGSSAPVEAGLLAAADANDDADEEDSLLLGRPARTPFHAALAKDHAAVLRPDLSPFASAEDVVRRLLPYHVWNIPHLDLLRSLGCSEDPVHAAVRAAKRRRIESHRSRPAQQSGHSKIDGAQDQSRPAAGDSDASMQVDGTGEAGETTVKAEPGQEDAQKPAQPSDKVSGMADADRKEAPPDAEMSDIEAIPRSAAPKGDTTFGDDLNELGLPRVLPEIPLPTFPSLSYASHLFERRQQLWRRFHTLVSASDTVHKRAPQLHYALEHLDRLAYNDERAEVLEDIEKLREAKAKLAAIEAEKKLEPGVFSGQLELKFNVTDEIEREKEREREAERLKRQAERQAQAAAKRERERLAAGEGGAGLPPSSSSSMMRPPFHTPGASLSVTPAPQTPMHGAGPPFPPFGHGGPMFMSPPGSMPGTPYGLSSATGLPYAAPPAGMAPHLMPPPSQFPSFAPGSGPSTPYATGMPPPMMVGAIPPPAPQLLPVGAAQPSPTPGPQPVYMPSPSPQQQQQQQMMMMMPPPGGMQPPSQAVGGTPGAAASSASPTPPASAPQAGGAPASAGATPAPAPGSADAGAAKPKPKKAATPKPKTPAQPRPPPNPAAAAAGSPPQQTTSGAATGTASPAGAPSAPAAGTDPNATGVPPPVIKRGRGRPRKNPLEPPKPKKPKVPKPEAAAAASDQQGGSGTPPAQQMPFAPPVSGSMPVRPPMVPAPSNVATPAAANGATSSVATNAAQPSAAFEQQQQRQQQQQQQQQQQRAQQASSTGRPPSAPGGAPSTAAGGGGGGSTSSSIPRTPIPLLIPVSALPRLTALGIHPVPAPHMVPVLGPTGTPTGLTGLPRPADPNQPQPAVLLGITDAQQPPPPPSPAEGGAADPPAQILHVSVVLTKLAPAQLAGLASLMQSLQGEVEREQARSGEAKPAASSSSQAQPQAQAQAQARASGNKQQQAPPAASASTPVRSENGSAPAQSQSQTQPILATAPGSSKASAQVTTTESPAPAATGGEGTEVSTATGEGLKGANRT